MKEIRIETDTINLDQLLKFSGYVGTGGQAKVYIQDGLVSVNEKIVTKRGKKIQKGDIITIQDIISFIVV